MCPLRPGCFARPLARVGHLCGMLLIRLVNLAGARAPERRRVQHGRAGTAASDPVRRSPVCRGPARDFH